MRHTQGNINPSVVKERMYSLEYYVKNRDDKIAYAKSYYLKNREKILAKTAFLTDEQKKDRLERSRARRHEARLDALFDPAKFYGKSE